MNFGTTSLAAPQAASSSRSIYSRTERRVVASSRQSTFIRACKRALFIGVGCDQTGIDGEALTTDEALTEGVIVAEATMLGRLGLYFLS